MIWLLAGSKAAWAAGCWERWKSAWKSNDNCCLWTRPGQYIVLELGGVSRGYSEGNMLLSVSYEINVFEVLLWDMDKWDKSGDCYEMSLHSAIELCCSIWKKKCAIIIFWEYIQQILCRRCMCSSSEHCLLLYLKPK